MTRKTFLVSIVLAVGLFLSACGAGSTPLVNDPAPTETEAPAVAAADAPVAEEPSAADAPAAAEGPVEVQVTMGDNWIKASMTTFKVGVPYVFIVENTGRRKHMFSISKPAEKTTNAIRQAQEEALLTIPHDDLIPGAVLTVEYTFTAPAGPGELEFACLIEKHYKDGQYLAIIVES